MYVKVEGKIYKVHEKDNKEGSSSRSRSRTYFIVRSKTHKQRVSDPSQFIMSLPRRRNGNAPKKTQEKEKEKPQENAASLLKEENAQYRMYLEAAKDEIESQQRENEQLTLRLKQQFKQQLKQKSSPSPPSPSAAANHEDKKIKHLKQQVLKLSTENNKIQDDFDELTVEYERIYNENMRLNKKIEHLK